MTTARRSFGDLGERLAAHHLEAKGYRIVARNYRRAEGEIDIIARGGETLVFVEVKSRRGVAMGSASEAITRVKAARLAQLAEAYADEHEPGAGLRIDLIAIDFAPDGRMLSLTHHENAITGD
ncbi:MAG TPA: YraN family protein [Dehalococcoidia bacterium]|jgi:putative endonuclease|nr:YraN family protein [Dehalococcoidia bacterium]